MPSALACRFCGAPLAESFLDLGLSPLANSYVKAEDAGAPETFYPLHVRVCGQCLLVQLPVLESAEQIFSDYLYFSSFSDSWLRHAESYAGMIAGRLGLTAASKVVEIASNDGYLLQYFKARGIPVLGVEPAANVAQAALAKGIPTDVSFFSVKTAERLKREGHAADLVAANNVLAHVPDLNDFVAGMRVLLRPAGTITVEFPHLLNLIEERQFDTIYHEHFSYFSLLVAEKVFARHGLQVFDVEQLSTHGGSLRIYARHAGGGAVSERILALRAREAKAGLDRLETYRGFGTAVADLKGDILEFLIGARRAGKTVVGYGAPAKGNTLLNYLGVKREYIGFTVDRNVHKQGHLLPGTRIPIRAPEAIFAAKPDYVLILPWNLRDEITAQLAGIRAWGGRFVVPIPALQIL
ncbi:MAG TPA: class I SAM-dependent methyltransferase [Acetobacteraceae bacterium]|nr:class I SAM-dependent methyltransferase [Acetobacteraceae bacterium]